MPGALVRSIAPPEEVSKWEGYALRSFVEDNRKMSWWVEAPREGV